MKQPVGPCACAVDIPPIEPVIFGNPASILPPNSDLVEDYLTVDYVQNNLGVFKSKPINDYAGIEDLPTTNGGECTCDKDGYIILGVISRWDYAASLQIYVNERWISVGGQHAGGADAMVESCFSAYVKSGFKYRLYYSYSAHAYLLHD